MICPRTTAPIIRGLNLEQGPPSGRALSCILFPPAQFPRARMDLVNIKGRPDLYPFPQPPSLQRRLVILAAALCPWLTWLN